MGYIYLSCVVLNYTKHFISALSLCLIMAAKTLKTKNKKKYFKVKNILEYAKGMMMMMMMMIMMVRMIGIGTV